MATAVRNLNAMLGAAAGGIPDHAADGHARRGLPCIGTCGNLIPALTRSIDEPISDFGARGTGSRASAGVGCRRCLGGA